MQDYVGKEIKPGQTVLTPSRRGGDMWLDELRVIQVLENEEKIAGYNKNGRRVTVSVFKNTKSRGRVNSIVIIKESSDAEV